LLKEDGANMLEKEEIDYYDGETRCKGFVAHDKSIPTKKPCVLVAHDWGGRSRLMCEKAENLASLGYVGFAVDVYGGCQLGRDKVENKALMTPFVENRADVASRMLAAFKKVCDMPVVDEQNIAAIGYCFGGLCALDLARTGANLKGAVSFHGNLLAAKEAIIEPISAKLLILHGFEDRLVPPQQLTEFTTEMNQRNVDWQIHVYGHAYHSFTNPSANDEELGLHYDQLADKRSWGAMRDFLKEIFSSCAK
jgi:dienelactone hydrolase